MKRDPGLSGNAPPCLRVPSVIVPAARNYLLNPLHPEAKEIAVLARQTVECDARLFG
jgi:RES domain-containing protein